MAVVGQRRRRFRPPDPSNQTTPSHDVRAEQHSPLTRQRIVGRLCGTDSFGFCIPVTLPAIRLRDCVRFRCSGVPVCQRLSPPAGVSLLHLRSASPSRFIARGLHKDLSAPGKGLMCVPGFLDTAKPGRPSPLRLVPVLPSIIMTVSALRILAISSLNSPTHRCQRFARNLTITHA